MPYSRGYKLYEPLNPLSPNPSLDRLIKTFNEGTDYLVSDSSIVFTETTGTYLNGGETEYRYFVAFDDENVSVPSNVFSLLNLMPPTDISIQATEFDRVLVSLTDAAFASGYRYSIKNLTTNNTIEGVLPENKVITGLSALTQYEIKISSINSLNEGTEFTNPVLVTTLKIFSLTSSTIVQEITWTWEYDIEANTNRFELINADNSQVLYSGLNKTYTLPSPTQRYSVYVKVINNDNSYRNSQTLTTNVFSEYSSIFAFSTGTSYASKILGEYTIEFWHEFVDQLEFDISIYNNKIIQTYQKSVFILDGVEIGLFNLTINNLRKDEYILKQGATSSGFFKLAIKDMSYQEYKYRLQYSIANFTSETIQSRFDLSIYRPIKEVVYTRGIMSEDVVKNLLAKSITFADVVSYIKPQFHIFNHRTTPYGLKWGVHNDRTTPLARNRQIIYNPTSGNNIDSVDVIFTLATTNIDLESKVNKVRILCLGDSITAGAPAYDPYYGGTVWVSDLITGKTQTRNNIESQYPYWLQKRLGIDDFEVVNEGSGRRTSAEVLFHVNRQLDEYKPQFVIIMIGTNDLFAAQDGGAIHLQNVVNTTLFNIRQTVDAVLAKGATPILGTQLPRNSIVPREAKDALRNLNIGIKNLGIEKVIDIIDWYDVFVQKDSSGKENGVLRYDLTVDDTHPSVLGYKTMAYSINLGIFNSFRASIRLFDKLKGDDVDYSSEDTRSQPDPYTLNYQITFPQMRRLQNYVFPKYLKNTGNSWGMFIIDLNDPDDICEVWDETNKIWTKSMVGQLAPNQIMELRMKYTMPATGRKKQVDFNIDYIVKK